MSTFGYLLFVYYCHFICSRNTPLAKFLGNDVDDTDGNKNSINTCCDDMTARRVVPLKWTATLQICRVAEHIILLFPIPMAVDLWRCVRGSA